MKYFIMLLFLIGFVGTSHGFEPSMNQAPLSYFGYFDNHGDKVTTLVIGEEYLIKAKFFWSESYSQPYEFFAEINDDKNHKVIERLSVQGTMTPNNELEIEFSWTPKETGEFRNFSELWATNKPSVITGVPQYDFKVMASSPRKQIQSGIIADHIQCNVGLVLTQRIDGSPACVTEQTKTKLVERGWTKLIEYKIRDNYEAIKKHPTVKAFYEKYSDAIEEIRNDHVSYVTGSDEGFKVRMKLFFDENYELDHIDFHCYFQREHQNDVPESFILTYLKDFECEKRSAPAIVIIPYGSASPENQFHLIPEEITIVLGKNSTVTWINQDDFPSTLTSDSSGWSTGVINPGDRAYVMFNETGVYPYHGEPHPWKIGKVIVLAN